MEATPSKTASIGQISAHALAYLIYFKAFCAFKGDLNLLSAALVTAAITLLDSWALASSSFSKSLLRASAGYLATIVVVPVVIFGFDPDFMHGIRNDEDFLISWIVAALPIWCVVLLLSWRKHRAYR